MDLAVRESPYPALKLGRDIFQVCRLLNEDRNQEALQMVRRLLQENPDVDNLRDLHRQAEIAVAFESAEYDTFLAKAKEDLATQPDYPRTVAQVASALACKYAVTGEENYKAEATETLDKARALAGSDDADFKECEERILHRLRTRDIINRKEYDRRFRSPATQPAGE